MSERDNESFDLDEEFLGNVSEEKCIRIIDSTLREVL